MIDKETLEKGYYERYLKELADRNNAIFEDVTIQPGQQPYVLNYHNRRHVFAYATFDITIFQVAAPIFTVTLKAGVWTNISFRDGERFQTSTANAQFLVKCTDEQIP